MNWPTELAITKLHEGFYDRGKKIVLEIKFALLLSVTFG